MSAFVASLIPPLAAEFRAAGWTPGRVASLDGGGLDHYPAFSLESALLREVGGLHVGRVGPGTECAASDIFFATRIRRDRAEFLSRQFPGVGQVIPIGTAYNDHVMLFLDNGLRYLAFTDIDSKLYVAAHDFPELVKRLLWGYRWDFPANVA